MAGSFHIYVWVGRCPVKHTVYIWLIPDVTIHKG